MRSACLAAGLAAVAAPALAAPEIRPTKADVAALILPPITTYELTVDGRAYAIFVMRPAVATPPGGFPLMVVLDANAHFAAAANAAYIQSYYGDIAPIMLVGIGYPDRGADKATQARRGFDFTNPAKAKTEDPYFSDKATGGAKSFREDVVRAVVAKMDQQEPVNPKCHVLFGHSLSGLFVVDTLFRDPSMFEGYFAASPSLHNNGAEILSRIPSVDDWNAKLTHPVRLHLAVGMGEASLSDHLLQQMPEYRTAPNYRQVSNLSRLTETLWDQRVAKMQVTSEILAGESHVSVLPRIIGQAVTFASQCSAVPAPR